MPLYNVDRTRAVLTFGGKKVRKKKNRGNLHVFRKKKVQSVLSESKGSRERLKNAEPARLKRKNEAQHPDLFVHHEYPIQETN